jgi:hypothetical protein
MISPFHPFGGTAAGQAVDKPFHRLSCRKADSENKKWRKDPEFPLSP